MKEQKPIPVIRANSKDLDLIFGLFAAEQELDRIEHEMERRIKVIPYGLRDLRLVRSLLDKLGTHLLATIQPEKRATMSRMAGHMRYKVICGPEATKITQDEVIFATADMNVLMTYAHKNCEVCLETRCNQCPLGKVFDRNLAYDRNGRSWAFVEWREE